MPGTGSPLNLSCSQYMTGTSAGQQKRQDFKPVKSKRKLDLNFCLDSVCKMPSVIRVWEVQSLLNLHLHKLETEVEGTFCKWLHLLAILYALQHAHSLFHTCFFFSFLIFPWNPSLIALSTKGREAQALSPFKGAVYAVRATVSILSERHTWLTDCQELCCKGKGPNDFSMAW